MWELILLEIEWPLSNWIELRGFGSFLFYTWSARLIRHPQLVLGIQIEHLFIPKVFENPVTIKHSNLE